MSIYRLFDGLDLCAPGDADSLIRAAAGLAATAAVLDAGSGRGADLPLLLSLVPQGRVTAIDLSEEFIAHIRRRFPQVRAEAGDMTRPPGCPYDLIWSGGAIYGPGVTPALQAWAPCLAPGGRVAFTDLVLTGPDIPPEVADFFAAEEVALRGEAELAQEVRAAGFETIDSFWLPTTAWDAYYGPLERRLAALTPAADPAQRWLIDSFRCEIDLWRRHGRSYGYLLTVAVPR